MHLGGAWKMTKPNLCDTETLRKSQGQAHTSVVPILRVNLGRDGRKVVDDWVGREDTQRLLLTRPGLLSAVDLMRMTQWAY